MENKKFYDTDWFMWIMLIFVAPVGIYLMFKNKRFNVPKRIVFTILFLCNLLVWVGAIGERENIESCIINTIVVTLILMFAAYFKQVHKKVGWLCLIAFIVVVGAFLIHSATSDFKSEAANKKVLKQAKQQTKQESERKKSTDNSTLEEYLKANDNMIVDINNSTDISGYVLIKIKYDTDSGKALASECFNTLNLLRQHKDYSKVTKVGIMFIADFADTYGNKSEQKSCSADFERSELNKIKWDNFNSDNIFLLSNDKWFHDSIKDDIK